MGRDPLPLTEMGVPFNENYKEELRGGKPGVCVFISDG